MEKMLDNILEQDKQNLIEAKQPSPSKLVFHQWSRFTIKQRTGCPQLDQF